MNLNLGFFRYVWYWIIKFGSKIVEITTKNSNSLYNGIRNFHFSEFANSISYSHISLSINLLPLRRYWFTFNSHEFLSEAATGGVMLKKSVFGNFAKFIYFFFGKFGVVSCNTRFEIRPFALLPTNYAYWK